MDLLQAIGLPDEYFEADPTPLEKLAVPDGCSQVSLPLPSVNKDESDKKLLIERQWEDETLAKPREMAKRGENGYHYRGDVLVYTDQSLCGLGSKKIVRLQPRRLEVLKLAHSRLTAGHSGVKRTKAKINNHFSWPGMGKDVLD